MKTPYRRYIKALALIVLAFLVGCTPTATDEASPAPTQSPLTTPDTLDSPLPIVEDALPNWDDEPAEGKSVIRGQIELTSGGVILGEILLANTIPTNNPDIEMLEIDQNNQIKAAFDRDTMRFIFPNIEPGKYGLVAWEPMSSQPLNDPETGETLFVEVKAGEVVDVGTLRFP
ncbi:MAG: hypothetical protein JXB35_08160 [Anaerolineae bacterium]|nr:hypothetical protein [Anaerolineae bacterium]